MRGIENTPGNIVWQRFYTLFDRHYIVEVCFQDCVDLMLIQIFIEEMNVIYDLYKHVVVWT